VGNRCSLVCLEITGLVVLPAEWQVIALAPSVENLAFSLFDGRARALLLSGIGECWASMTCGEGSLLAPAE
jgi:hypothetical protein